MRVKVGGTYRHLKRGGTYQVVGIVPLSASVAQEGDILVFLAHPQIGYRLWVSELGNAGADTAFVERFELQSSTIPKLVQGTEIVLYRCLDDGPCRGNGYARAAREFEDGRFVEEAGL